MTARSPEARTATAEAAAETAPTDGPVIHDSRRWSRDGSATPPARTESAAPAPTRPAPEPEALDAGPLLRIGTMIRKVLDEVRETPLDDRARERVRELRTRAVEELVSHLGPDLRHELQALDVPLPAGEDVGDVELRIAQAQLVGWLEGLFQGAQMALAAQQLAASSQLGRLRREATQAQRDTAPGSAGQYL
jgi:hypothetical protein